MFVSTSELHCQDHTRQQPAIWWNAARVLWRLLSVAADTQGRFAQGVFVHLLRIRDLLVLIGYD
jgi:hypothetical protein